MRLDFAHFLPRPVMLCAKHGGPPGGTQIERSIHEMQIAGAIEDLLSISWKDTKTPSKLTIRPLRSAHTSMYNA